MRIRPTGSETRTASSLLRLSVCLLLVALLLYNPFFSLVASSNGLTFHELPRHRATVGAGEMQHFSPIAKVAAPAGPIVECVGDAVAMAHRHKFAPAMKADWSPSSLNDYSSQLWFRPPPTA